MIVNLLILLHRYCNSICPYGVNILFVPFRPYKYLIFNALFLLINMIFPLFSLYRFCNYANVSTVGLIKVFFYSILLMQHLLWKENTWMDASCCSWINNVILKFAFFLFQTFYKPCKIHCFLCREPAWEILHVKTTAAVFNSSILPMKAILCEQGLLLLLNRIE